MLHFAFVMNMKKCILICQPSNLPCQLNWNCWILSTRLLINSPTWKCIKEQTKNVSQYIIAYLFCSGFIAGCIITQEATVCSDNPKNYDSQLVVLSKLKIGGLGELDEGEQLLDVVVVLPEPPPHVGLEEGQGEPGPSGEMALDVQIFK